MEKEKKKSNCIKLILIGAGNRGHVYSNYVLEHPETCKIIAIAEPRDVVRLRYSKEFGIEQKYCFKDWKDLVNDCEKKEKIDADAVIITLQDRYHAECAIAIAHLKYNILLEKPMAITEKDCHDIVHAVKENNVMFAVCHVLRYSILTQKVKQFIDQGKIGNIMNIQHIEPVGWFHFAHSYVRGNWKKEGSSSFSLMTKCCHDIDWITHVMDGKIPKTIHSFGSLMHFNQKNKPNGAADRCLDCPSTIERVCPYSAKKIYLDPFLISGGGKGFSCHSIVTSGEVPDIENVTDALKNSDYGKCVYSSDNDVMDNQVVSMVYESGTTATISMVACTADVCQRKTRIYGHLGELDIVGNHIRHFDFNTKEYTNYDMEKEEISKIQHSKLKSHGYADYYLMNSFVEAIKSKDHSKLLSNAEETLKTHLLVFAAEKSRKSGLPIDCTNLSHP